MTSDMPTPPGLSSGGSSADLLWQTLTRFGESGILLPVLLVAAFGLGWSARRADGPLRLLLPIALAATLVTATKIAFLGFGWGIASLDFTGISGHAMLAFGGFPVLAAIFVAPAARRKAVAVAAAVAGLVAVSRIAVGAHSASEVVSGCLIGAVAGAIATRSLVYAGGRGLSPAWLLPAFVWLLLTLSAPPVMATHDWITEIALTLSGRDRPYVRADLYR
jgi:membrane-associated phospholipid phosphatase